jgi:hypothetical protein
MHVRRLSKIGIALGVIVLAGVLMLARSVALGNSVTSEKTQPAAVLAQREAAPVLQKVSSILKRKRPVLVASTSPINTAAALLPVVRQKDISEHHQKLADKVLRALPSPCRTYLKNFYVQYSGAKRRGLGGKSTIILDGSVNDTEFAALFTHECGHVTHGNLLGGLDPKPSAFKDGKDIFYNDSPAAQFFAISWTTEMVMKSNVAEADFVSGYAKSDAFEDFAETFAMYILHRPALKERAKTNTVIAAKLAWMEMYLPVSETAVSTSSYSWNKEVPWDVTKLAMTLN